VKTIVLTHSAAKDLDALPQAAQQSVIEGLNSYAMTGKGDVKKLSGREGYRLRIGAYRIIFSEDAVTILAIHRLPIYIDLQEKLIMIPIRPQTIRSASGEELIVLTRAEFDALIADVADQLEDADDVAVFDERMAALQNGQDARLPAEVTAAMLSGDSLIRALRRWKGLTQTDLAERTKLAQGYISDLENHRKSGTNETLHAVTAALGIDPAWLLPR
jgi:mRNA-degrading endonuclease RelE of RelBE toxin-antitoxin system